MLKKQPKDYFRKRLAERLKKDPHAKLDDLSIYINMLGVQEVQDAQRKGKNKRGKNS